MVEVASGGDKGSAVGRGSPASSRRSDCTSVSATFQRCREQFQKELEKLKTNTTSAPDAKKLKASLLRTRLKDMAIRDIIHSNGTDPDFLDLFGANAEDLLLWLEVTECELKDLETEYVNQMARIKSCTQLGFQKHKYPQFTGKTPDYYSFKQC